MPLTRSKARGYLPKLDSKRCTPMNWAGSNEADIQAAQSQARKQARIPCPHEDRRWSQDSQPAPESRSYAARGQDRRQVVDTISSRGEGLRREARIRLGSEIRGLLERGERKRTKNLDVFFTASPVSHSRLGLIVPKHGHRIVDRNLVKRRLRDIGRKVALPHFDLAGVHLDVILRARRSAYGADFGTLEGEVTTVVEGLCSRSS